jgi:predicted nucleotidyltransferase
MSTTVVSQKRDQAKAVARVLAAIPGVEGVCVFGSVAREQARVGSDIDLLVLGTDEWLAPSMLLRRLPVELRTVQLSLSYHTADSLDRYLHRRSRFGAHLRREGWILYDPLGELRRAFATDIPVSTAEELAAQRVTLITMHIWSVSVGAFCSRSPTFTGSAGQWCSRSSPNTGRWSSTAGARLGPSWNCILTACGCRGNRATCAVL